MNWKYSIEVRSFIIENARGNSLADLTAMVNKRFGTCYTESCIQYLKHKLGAKSGIDTRLNGTQGKATRYKKGSTPFTKGRKWDEYLSPEAQESCRRTCFKKGSIPHNHLPVGSEIIKSDGYFWVKLAEPDEWKQKHHLIWEEANGPIPEGCCLTFLDGDRMNVTLENLMLVSMSENCYLSASKVRGSGVPELTKAVVGIKRLRDKTEEIMRKEA